MQLENSDTNQLLGSYDNFLQIWKEQTEEELHRDKRGYAHEHIHIKIERDKTSDDHYQVSFFKGRNNIEFLGKKQLHLNEFGSSTDCLICVGEDDSISLSSGLGLIDNQEEEPYRLKKCRPFSGFIEYALTDDHEEYHRKGDLEIHDQGGMAELIYEGNHFTVELTQLVFAHKIYLMKVAIYDVPMSEVGINSKAISYAWTSPKSKRLGINIRRLITGWTYIEEGFLSSNNMDLDEQ